MSIRFNLTKGAGSVSSWVIPVRKQVSGRPFQSFRPFRSLAMALGAGNELLIPPQLVQLQPFFAFSHDPETQARIPSRTKKYGWR